MSETDRKARVIDGVQGICVLVAITFSLIPLGQHLFGVEQGFLFRRVFGELADPAAWVVPLVVLAATVTVIGVLEAVKKH